MADEIKGPGILIGEGRISRPDLLDEATFFKWYDEVHIPEVIATGGVDSAFRYTLPGAERPYIAMYEARDIAFVQSDKFRNLHLQSDLLPGSQLIYDLADVNVRCYRLEQVFDPHKVGPGRTKAMMVAEVELKEGYPEKDLDDWFRTEHLPMLAKYPGYLRSTRFKLAFMQSAAQARAAQGLPPTIGEAPRPPTWLALHEFDTADLDLASLQAATASDWTKKIYENSATMLLPIYQHTKTHGTGEWFHSFPSDS